MSELAFFVPGVPSAQGSKRHVGSGRMVDMNKNLQPWRDSITYAALHAGRAALLEELGRDIDHSDWPIFTGPVHVSLGATYARPKSHYRTGSKSHLLRDDHPHDKATAPDVDKIARAALDAITASGIWRDDAQVAYLAVSKTYAEQAGLIVRIQEAS